VKTHVVVTAAAAVLATLAVAASVEGGVVDRRQAVQRARIARGAVTGALTPCETVRLAARASSIARQEAFMRATGGGLSGRERAILDHRLDSLSGAIRRESHDRQRRR